MSFSVFSSRLQPISLVAFCSLIAVLLIPASAWSSSIDRGIDWLDERQRDDGSYRPGVDVAHALQADAEAEAAFIELNDAGPLGSSALIEALAARADDHTEFLALAIRQAGLRGNDAPDLLEALLARQRRDGGFAEAPGHPGSIHATTLALLALHHADGVHDDVIVNAVGFLRAQQRDDGSWQELDGRSRIYTTSLAMQSLVRHASTLPLADTLGSANDFLIAARDSSGGYGTSWKTAHALLALLPTNAREEVTEPTLAWLLERQAENGSWSGDVYSTGIALRALDAAQRLGEGDTVQPDDPDGGTLIGRVVSATDGAPVAQAEIRVESDDMQLATTGSDGGFELVVPAGEELTLIYIADGFGDATQPVQVSPGGLVELGEITLEPLPDTGRLIGTVADRDTGSPLTDAEVVITGDAHTQAAVGAEGTYAVVLSDGSYTASIETPDYHPAKADFDLAVGQTLDFSPGLTPESDAPPDDQPSAVQGELRSAATGEPLVGALVSSDTLEVATDDAGRFRFEEIDSGARTFMITAGGYVGLTLSLILSPGETADLGTIELDSLDAPDTVTFQGNVSDLSSNEPIEGASVSVGDQSTTADGDGHYTIAGLAVGEITVAVSAEGYRTRSRTFTIQTGGTAEVSIGLEPRVRRGLRLSALRTDASDYGAYRDVDLELDLENTGTDTVVTRLYLAVFDGAGELLSDEPITPVLDAGEGSTEEALEEARIRIDSLEEYTEAFSWFTEAREPGEYELRVRALEAFTGDLLGERSRTIHIEPTRRVELLSIRPVPLYLTQGSSDDVGFAVLVQHRSNESFPLEAAFDLLNPDGEVMISESFAMDLFPAETDRRIGLPAATLVADDAGAYEISIDPVDGPEPDSIHGQSLFIAPGTRIEIEQRRTPGTVAPDGHHHIELELRLEGEAE